MDDFQVIDLLNYGNQPRIGSRYHNYGVKNIILSGISFHNEGKFWHLGTSA